jgi:hypothetical protein
MRRLCPLFALVALASAMLAGTAEAADARKPRAKVKRREHPPAASTAHPAPKRPHAKRSQVDVDVGVTRTGVKRSQVDVVRVDVVKRSHVKRSQVEVDVGDQGGSQVDVGGVDVGGEVGDQGGSQVDVGGGEVDVGGRGRGPTWGAMVVIPRRLMIVGFEGRGAQVMRGAIAGALRTVRSMRVVPIRPAEAVRLGTEYGAEKTTDLARRFNLTAALYGTIREDQGNVQLTLWLANGEDGRLIGELDFDARNLGALRARVRAQIWGKLRTFIDQAASPGPAVAAEKPVAGGGAEQGPEAPSSGPETSGAAHAAPRPSPRPPGKPPAQTRRPAKRPLEPGRSPADANNEPAPVGEAEPAPPSPTPPGRKPSPTGTSAATAEDAPQPEGAAGAADASEAIAAGVETHAAPMTDRCSTADLSTSGGVMARRFNYRDEQRGALRGYALIRAPVGRVEGTLYPFASASASGPCRLLSGFGLRATYDRMGAVTSQLADRRLSTHGSAYQIELVLRLPRGHLTLQPSIGYVARQYSVEDQVVPTADYRALGAGLDVTVRTRLIAFEVGAGARRLLSSGTLQSDAWFPGSSAFAVAAHAQLALAVTDWVDAVLGGAVEYESFTFPIDPNAPYPNGVAAGAHDLFLQGTLGVRARLGQSPASTSRAPR